MTSTIDKLVIVNAHCTKCGSKGVGSCTCWTRCKCGWLYETSIGPSGCCNPLHSETIFIIPETRKQTADFAKEQKQRIKQRRKRFRGSLQ